MQIKKLISPFLLCEVLRGGLSNVSVVSRELLSCAGMGILGPGFIERYHI